MTIKSTSQLLRHARNTLMRNGWCRHQMQNEQGELCALGALERAASRHNNGFEYFSDAKKRLRRAVHQPDGREVAQINDWSIEDKAQAVAWFDAAADRRRAKLWV